MRRLLVVALSACSGSEPQPGGVQELLQDERYGWCHEPGQDGADVAAWCELVEQVPEEVCPGMHTTCSEHDFADAGCAGSGTPGRGVAGSPEDEWKDPELPETGCGGCDGDTEGCGSKGCQGKRRGGGFPVLLKWVVAFLLAVAVVAAIRMLLRRDPQAEMPSSLRPDEVDLGPMAADGLPAAPHDELLALARAALAEGRAAEALLLARAAALRFLGQAGRLQLHPSRTDREYARMARGEDREVLRGIIGSVEQLRWAGFKPDLRRAAEAVAAAAKLIGALLLALWSTPAEAGVRFGVWGDAAVIALMQEQGYAVSLSVPTVSDLTEEHHVLWLDLHRVQPSEADVGHLVDWVARGGILVLGGDPALIPDLLLERRLYRGRSELRTAGPLADLAPPRWPGGPTYMVCGEVRAWVVEVDGGESGDTGCSAAPVVHRTWGSGHVVAIGDSRLLANAAMIAEENRAFISGLLDAGQRAGLWELPDPTTVVFALMSGPTASSPDEALANSKLLPFLAQLMLVWGLLVLARGVPILPLRDPPAEGRRQATEHAVALGRRWRQAGAVVHAARVWARLWWQRLDERGITELARRRGMSEAEASRLAADVKGLVRGAPFSNEDARKVVEELWWVLDRNS